MSTFQSCWISCPKCLLCRGAGWRRELWRIRGRGQRRRPDRKVYRVSVWSHSSTAAVGSRQPGAEYEQIGSFFDRAQIGPSCKSITLSFQCVAGWSSSKKRYVFMPWTVHNPNGIQALSSIFFSSSGVAGRPCVWDVGSCWDRDHWSPDDRWRSLQHKHGLP